MIDLVTYYGSRLACRLLGHSWVPGWGGWQFCSRRACRGRSDASRRVS